MNNLKGSFLIGTFVGYSETPWTTDNTKLNRRIGIQTGVFTDQFGQEQTTTESVDIQLSDAERIKNIADDLKGKEVVIPVVYRARKGGRNGAFLSCFMPQGAQLSLLQNFNRQPVAKAS